MELVVPSPRSTSWIGVRSLTHAEDETVLTHNPYFGDRDMEGVDTSAFDAVEPDHVIEHENEEQLLLQMSAAFMLASNSKGESSAAPPVSTMAELVRLVQKRACGGAGGANVTTKDIALDKNVLKAHLQRLSKDTQLRHIFNEVAAVLDTEMEKIQAHWVRLMVDLVLLEVYPPSPTSSTSLLSTTSSSLPSRPTLGDPTSQTSNAPAAASKATAAATTTTTGFTTSSRVRHTRGLSHSQLASQTYLLAGQELNHKYSHSQLFGPLCRGIRSSAPSYAAVAQNYREVCCALGHFSN
jgi:hypothetical protein